MLENKELAIGFIQTASITFPALLIGGPNSGISEK